MKTDINYNYFEDVNPDCFTSDYDYSKGVSPDSCSTKLYDALFKIFFYDEDENEKYNIPIVQIRGQKFKNRDLFYSFFISRNKYDVACRYPSFILSADYIGPSIYWCTGENVKAEDIIKTARTLGGHMVWPRDVSRENKEKRWVTLYYYYGSNKKSKYYTAELSMDEIERFKKEKEREDHLVNGKWGTSKITINTEKGGEYGLYDRMDCLLKLLELYYQLLHRSEDVSRPSEEEFLKACTGTLYNGMEMNWKEEIRISNIYYAFDNSYEWLKVFGDFKSFCTFFKLKNSFVDKDYHVIPLEGELFPVQRPGEVYVKNNLEAIQSRNRLLERLLVLLG